jgi:hypothetical protein
MTAKAKIRWLLVPTFILAMAGTPMEVPTAD